MKHIVIDARESGTSTGRYIDKLVEYLHKLEPDYKVTLMAKPHRLDYYAGIAPDFERQECNHKEFTFDEQIGFKHQIERLQPDLVHFPAVHQPAWLQGSIPVVTTVQDLTTLRFRNPSKNAAIYTFKQQVYRWLIKHVTHKSHLLITPSQFVKDDVVQLAGIDPDKITVTLESADDLPTPAEPVPSVEGKRFIMYLGRPTPHKNLERLVYAFGRLQKRDPHLYLVLAGKVDANYRRIEAMTKATANQQGNSNVIFTDFISDQQLRWLYENCQAYVFPSLSEGFGLPGLEAMRHGAPVVSSNATCLPEIYGKAALYFDPLDIQDMADKIGTMLSDAKLRDKYISKGHRQAAKFSWQRMAEQTLEVYGKALKQNATDQQA